MPKRKKQSGKGSMCEQNEYKGHGPQGGGFADDFNNFLKQSHIVSNIGNVVAPALGGLAGTFLGGPAGTAIGAAVGSSANEFVKSQGYGKIRGRHAKIQGEGYLGGVPIGINRGQSKFDPRWIGKVSGGGRNVREKGRGIGLETSFGTVSNNRGSIKLS